MVVQSQQLETFAVHILTSIGVDEHKAGLVARSLVAANLRGVDSQGIQLLPYYAEQIEHGTVNVAVEGHVLSESGACLLYEGENALGQVTAEQCCKHAIRLAKTHGIAMVVARDSNHFGAAAYWGQRISATGLISVILSNTAPFVAPWQGKETRIGTNAICVTVPGANTWLLDMATTTVAAGRVFQAHFNHQAQIPYGWAMDAEGVPTTSTETAINGLLMPLGGYKGSGLAMLVEVLSAVVGGGAMSTQLASFRAFGQPARISQSYIAVDVTRFLPAAEFEARMEDLVAMVKSSAPAKGYDEVLVAGEPEWRTEEHRKITGIPIAPVTWSNLTAIALRHGIPIPE